MGQGGGGVVQTHRLKNFYTPHITNKSIEWRSSLENQFKKSKIEQE
jgi:hypothetical protein